MTNNIFACILLIMIFFFHLNVFHRIFVLYNEIALRKCNEVWYCNSLSEFYNDILSRIHSRIENKVTEVH